MAYADYLIPRQEVISEDGIEGIIDLANLADSTKRKLETRPSDFLELTYPTSDTKKVIENLHLRFQTSKGDVPGLFLFEGLKGSGKSHLLLLIYNLFNCPQYAVPWLERNGLEFRPLQDCTVIVNKFTDHSTYSIWELIFSHLGYSYSKDKPVPSLDNFNEAIGDKNIILIFDELEQGIKIIDDPAKKAQNISFLQMLSEFANRSRQVTIFSSIYSDREEPGSTLKRVPCLRVQFSDSRYLDRSNVILHRLFENSMSFDRSAISPVIQSYIQFWGRHTDTDQEDLIKAFSITYPFTPYLMDIILKKIPQRGGFQNVRGALGFLANMVKMTFKSKDVISSGDASLQDQETTIRLADLDVHGDLIRRAKENMEELSKYDYSVDIASSVLMSTLCDSSSNPGITKSKLLQEVLSPDRDINAFEQSLMAFQKYASFFHYNQEDQRYYFDLEENAEAKVEFASLNISDELAAEKLSVTLQEDVFRETASSVVYSDIKPTQEQLNTLDKKRLRYILSPRRLSQEERHAIYFGLDYRNLIVLLEPKDDKFHLASNRDLIKWAKRCIAGENLIKNTKEPARRTEYDRIVRVDKTSIVNSIKKAGLVFIRWEKYGQAVSEDIVELEPIGGDCSKDKVLNAINQDIYPLLTIIEHLESRIPEIKDHSVKEIDAEYRATLGFPVPAMASSVTKAIRELCRDGHIGLQHIRGSFCKENVQLSEQEIVSAKITSPFETGVEACPKCGKSPCVCETPKPEPCPVCNEYPCTCGIGGGGTTQVCPKCNQAPCVCSQVEIKTIRIAPQPNPNILRQETAFRLQQEGDFIAHKVTYKIYFEKSNSGDLSTLPAALRGHLSGQGDILAEITISKTGSFPKSQIEQQIESLPNLSDAEYSADLEIELGGEGK